MLRIYSVMHMVVKQVTKSKKVQEMQNSLRVSCLIIAIIKYLVHMGDL